MYNRWCRRGDWGHGRGLKRLAFSSVSFRKFATLHVNLREHIWTAVIELHMARAPEFNTSCDSPLWWPISSNTRTTGRSTLRFARPYESGFSDAQILDGRRIILGCNARLKKVENLLSGAAESPDSGAGNFSSHSQPDRDNPQRRARIEPIWTAPRRRIQIMRSSASIERSASIG